MDKESSSDSQMATVQLLGKDYSVFCPKEGRNDLQRAARLLDERMRTINDNGSVRGLDRIALMAALNLAHDLIKEQNKSIDKQMANIIEDMSNKLESAVSDKVASAVSDLALNKLDKSA